MNVLRRMVVFGISVVSCICACKKAENISTDQTTPMSEGGHKGGGGSPSAGGNSQAGSAAQKDCTRGDIIICDKDCSIPVGCYCVPVADKENDGLFTYCYPGGVKDPLFVNCGSNCGDFACCQRFIAGEIFSCTDIEVCKEGLARQQGSFTYSDYTDYTGQPPPNPSDCTPQITEIATCAPNCGQCKEDELCSGRSPTHPLGICFPKDADKLKRCDHFTKCSKDDLCFLWDHPRADSEGDDFGTCLPKETCLQLASYLPGGAHCHDSDGKTIDP